MGLMKRHVMIAAIVFSACFVAHAQEPIGSGFPTGYGAGWTFTPSLGFGETYDDNISLFGVSSGASDTDDFVQTWLPAADLHYEGRHTQFGIGYTGSFLQYQTFSALNRWSQHGRIELKRQENAHLKWSGHANVLSVPSTDFVDVGGVPFRRTGAITSDGRGAVDYAFNARDSVKLQAGYQTIHFEEPLTVDNILHGGHVYEWTGGWRHRLSERFGVGADYSFRRAVVVSSTEPFDLQSVEAGAGYELSPDWAIDGSAGVVYLAANAVADARRGPAWRLAIERHREARTFRAEYLRSYIPSFGFGGTVRDEEASLTMHTPLFHSRRWYTEQRVVFRDDQPLTTEFQQLPLRSLRTHSLLGWAPQPWVRLEVFYARTQQTNRLQLGQLYRNRVGFQIVTSKPMRMKP